MRHPYDCYSPAQMPERSKHMDATFLLNTPIPLMSTNRQGFQDAPTVNLSLTEQRKACSFTLVINSTGFRALLLPEIYFTYYKSCHFKQSSGFFSFTYIHTLSNHHRYLIPGYFHHIKKKPHSREQSFSILSSPRPLATTNLLPASINVPTQVIPLKRSDAICYFWWLLSLSIMFSTFIHIVACLRTFFFWIIFHHMDIPHFEYPFISWGTFGLLPNSGYSE